MHSAVWPRLLRQGGTIGVCSPAGPTKDPILLERGRAALAARGYRVVIATNTLAVGDPRDYLAGGEEERASDLNGLLRDPDIDLILAVRGGYGSAKILDRLDWSALRRDPKPIVGYSDITALSLGIAAQTGVVSFSGIMATVGHGFSDTTLDPFSEASLWQAVGEGAFPRTLSAPLDQPWHVLRGSGRISGPLFPVCLTLLTSLFGTPYVPDLTGGILVIEDVHEELYSIDRALTQLRLAGVLDQLAGVLVGSFNGVEGQDEYLAVEVPKLVAEMTPESVAVVSRVAYGHIPRRLTLPCGAMVVADTEHSQILVESAAQT